MISFFGNYYVLFQKKMVSLIFICVKPFVRRGGVPCLISQNQQGISE